MTGNGSRRRLLTGGRVIASHRRSGRSGLELPVAGVYGGPSGGEPSPMGRDK
jgi:hypothetical protein